MYLRGSYFQSKLLKVSYVRKYFRKYTLHSISGTEPSKVRVRVHCTTYFRMEVFYARELSKIEYFSTEVGLRVRTTSVLSYFRKYTYVDNVTGVDVQCTSSSGEDMSAESADSIFWQ